MGTGEIGSKILALNREELNLILKAQVKRPDVCHPSRQANPVSLVSLAYLPSSRPIRDPVSSKEKKKKGGCLVPGE